MKVQVRPMRSRGRNMHNRELLARPPFVGDLSVAESRDHELGRSVMRARLMDESSGNDILPELDDALLLWVSKNKLRFSGYERVEQAAYAQTWSVEML